ncbi:MAG: DNA mismatch endonuclease Vsr [Magnetococcales bacterium]|nr:DNA mismatch endonuclease Vsr [Magnetococcales bacterium]
MTDVFAPEKRSAVMAKIRFKDTRPELVVRRLVWRLGFRYRLHERRLPGRPDFVFWGRRKVIFVHGCFWHHHPGCKYAVVPATRREFWLDKLERNVERGNVNLKTLEQMGWKMLIIWECETRTSLNKLNKVILEFLSE